MFRVPMSQGFLCDLKWSRLYSTTEVSTHSYEKVKFQLRTREIRY